MTRRFPAHPIVSVGAVIVNEGQVLLARRAHAPLQGEWSLPGGGVEIGETLTAAVAREAREETGLSIAVGPVVDVLDRIQRTADGRIEFHYVIIDYLCRLVGHQSARAGSDAEDVRWASETDIDDFHLTERAQYVVRRALAMSREEATPPR